MVHAPGPLPPTHTHKDTIPGFPGTWASDLSGEKNPRGMHVRRVDGVSVASESTDAFFFFYSSL